MQPEEPGPSDELPTRVVPAAGEVPMAAPEKPGPAYADPSWFSAGAPTPGRAAQPDVATGPEVVSPTRTRRPRTAVIVLAAALVVVVVVAGLLIARMVTTTQAWEDSSTGWESLATTTANELATSQSDLAATQAELDATTAQLTTAQARITELADEKAQLGDTSASQQQLADYQARVSQAAGQVATALASCISGQQKLIGYLRASDQYDPTELAQFGEDVQTLCGKATDANASLQAELKR